MYHNIYNAIATVHRIDKRLADQIGNLRVGCGSPQACKYQNYSVFRSCAPCDEMTVLSRLCLQLPVIDKVSLSLYSINAKYPEVLTPATRFALEDVPRVLFAVV
jgi:hypothetical protein